MKLGSFFYKEAMHVLRDKRMLFVVLAIPIVQMLLFGFAISTEVNNLKVNVCTPYYDQALQQTINRISNNPYITFKGIIDATQIYPLLQKGEAEAVVVFDKDGKAQIVTDASNPNLAQSATIYLQAMIDDDGKADRLIDTHLLYNPQLKSSYNFAPGIMGMLFLLVCALMTAVAVVREKENGTMELLLVSPVRPIQIIVSKMIPFFLLSCIDLILILIIAKWLLDIPMSAGLLPIVSISLLYIVLSLGFGLLVSTLSKSQVMAMLICGMVMIMPVVMLSGLIFPVDNLPIILKQISCIVPARWYIDAMRKLMIEGLDWIFVIDDLIILTGMTIFIMIIAIRNFKIRLS